MDVEINDGITLINKYEGYYNVQFIPKDNTIEDVLIEVKEFLLACGYSKDSIEEYIEEF